MTIIKTKVRTMLTAPTLSALMMISSNGPKRRDYAPRNEYRAAIRELAVEAREYWKAKTKRCIGRSKPGKKSTRKKKKSAGRTLSDLVEAQLADA